MPKFLTQNSITKYFFKNKSFDHFRFHFICALYFLVFSKQEKRKKEKCLAEVPSNILLLSPYVMRVKIAVGATMTLLLGGGAGGNIKN